MALARELDEALECVGAEPVDQQTARLGRCNRDVVLAVKRDDAWALGVIVRGRCRLHVGQQHDGSDRSRIAAHGFCDEACAIAVAEQDDPIGRDTQLLLGEVARGDHVEGALGVAVNGRVLEARAVARGAAIVHGDHMHAVLHEQLDRWIPGTHRLAGRAAVHADERRRRASLERARAPQVGGNAAPIQRFDVDPLARGGAVGRLRPRGMERGHRAGVERDG